MSSYNSLLSSWNKNNNIDDSLVNLSNKKNQHSVFSASKDSNLDRYIAHSIQKCLFKDKL
jgi:hypothetical protein